MTLSITRRTQVCPFQWAVDLLSSPVLLCTATEKSNATYRSSSSIERPSYMVHKRWENLSLGAASESLVAARLIEVLFGSDKPARWHVPLR